MFRECLTLKFFYGRLFKKEIFSVQKMSKLDNYVQCTKSAMIDIYVQFYQLYKNVDGVRTKMSKGAYTNVSY